jgi:hypothetical protein
MAVLDPETEIRFGGTDGDKEDSEMYVYVLLSAIVFVPVNRVKEKLSWALRKQRRDHVRGSVSRHLAREISFELK